MLEFEYVLTKYVLFKNFDKLVSSLTDVPFDHYCGDGGADAEEV